MKVDNYKWLAIARESLMRAGATASEADSAIGELTGDSRDTVDEQEWAFDFCAQLESDHSELETIK